MKALKKIGNLIRYLFGILFIIAAFGFFEESVPTAIFSLLFGISLLPIAWKFTNKKKKIFKIAPIILPIILFIATAFVMPETEDSASETQIAAEETSKAEDKEQLKVESDNNDDKEQAEVDEDSTSSPVKEKEDDAEAKVESESTYDMTVHFLDVGQGLSVFVQSNGQNLIYDGGDTDDSSFVVAYLKDQGVSTIDYLISSHYDSDHVAGLIGCLNTFDVKNVICSDYVHDSQLYTSFVNNVVAKNLEMKHPSVGTEFSFGTGNFTILAPSIIGNDSNNNSVAIKLTNGENSFIFTGDAESSSESDMCNSGIDLSCDVLVLGHHGSATATSYDFLQKTIPEFAVISCGTDNQYGHPDKDTMDKLESMNIQVYRTDKQGTITVKSDGIHMKWNAEPCNDYSAGDKNDTGTQPQQQEQLQQETANTIQNTQESQPSVSTTNTEVQEIPGATEQVWVSATGEKYHNKNNCGRMNPSKSRQMSRSEAEALGLEPCSKCY